MKTSPTMQRVITALAEKHGLNLESDGAHLRLELGQGWMPLVIEVLTRGLISVAHYYTQNGDLIADPDVEFLITDAGWLPVAVQQIGGYHAYIDNPRGQDGLAEFCETWARNIEHQGWLVRGRQPDPTITTVRQNLEDGSAALEAIIDRVYALSLTVPQRQVVGDANDQAFTAALDIAKPLSVLSFLLRRCAGQLG